MTDFIPQFTLDRQWQQIGEEILHAAQRVFLSGRYVLGPENEALEREVQAALNTPFTLACATGTDALHLALRAAGVGAGNVVLTTPFTFFATAGAVLLTGARLELVDIDPRTFTIDAAQVEERLAQSSLSDPGRGQRSQGGQGESPSQSGTAARIAALLPVHLYGRMAAMDRLVPLARNAGLPVIEDAAQAWGASEVDSATGAPRSAGTWGDAGCFSFYPTKNLGAMGEGGLVTTPSNALIERLRLLRVHGSRKRYEHGIVGWNARMDELQAAVLRVKLPYAREWVHRRQRIAATYEERLLAAGLAALPQDRCAAGLRHAPAEVRLILPERTPGHAFHQYIVRVRRRGDLRAFLSERKIGTEVYYPIPVHRQPVLREDPVASLSFPHAEAAAEEVLGLPMFPELTESEIDRITDSIIAFYRRH